MIVPPCFGVPVVSETVAASAPATLPEDEDEDDSDVPPAAPVVDEPPPQAESTRARVSAVAAAMTLRVARRGVRGWVLLEERFLSCLFMLGAKLD